MDPFDRVTAGRPAVLIETARLVAEIVERREPELDAAVKWGRLTYATGGDYHHWICAIGTTKNAVGLTFHFGGLFDDPDGNLTSGSSTFLRKLEYSNPDEVDADVVCGFLDQALERYPFFKEHGKELR